MGRPFFTRGGIGREHSDAWLAMVRREPLSTNIIRDLQRDPPEFVTLIAPDQNGKTTFAKQLIARIQEQGLNLAPVFLEMGQQATEEGVVRNIAVAMIEQLHDLLEQEAESNATPARAPLRVPDAPLRTLDDLRVLLGEFIAILPDSHVLVLMVDDIASLSEELQNALLIFFRSLHANRFIDPLLQRLSVVIFSVRSLMIRELEGTSPYNVSREHELPDLTRQEVGEFLDRCVPLLDGISFTPEAVEYLFSQTAGHAILIQKICADAVTGVAPGQKVKIKHVLRGITSCFEYPNRYASSLLNVDELSPEVLDKLLRLVFQDSVLPWHNVGELVQRGIAKRGKNNRCAFRSPLIHTLFVSKFDGRLQRLQELEDLTQKEKDIAMLPQVSILLLNNPLKRAVEERLAERGFELEPSGSFWESTYASEAAEILEEMDPTFDEQGMQYFVAYYFQEHLDPIVEKSDVLRLVAKVFAMWATDNRPA